MKQLFRRLMPVLLAACLLLVSDIPVNAYAETETAAAALEGGGCFPVGKTFSVTLSYEGEDLAAAGAEVAYDSSLLEFISCDGDEVYCDDQGTIRLSLIAETDEKTNASECALSCRIRFRAIAAGDGFITATTIRLASADGAERSAQTRSVKMTVTEAAEPTETAEMAEMAAPSDEAAETSEDTVFQFELFCLAVTVLLLVITLVCYEIRKKRKRMK